MCSLGLSYKVNADILKTVAKDTEYYLVDKIEGRRIDENQSENLIILWHKKYGNSAEKLEINISLVKEDGVWKISGIQ